MLRPVLALLLGIALLAVDPGSDPALAGAACSAGYVSLTFDDGPSATVTPRLVRTLEKLHVPATFFMVGERVATAPAAAQRVAKAGFLIANHSYRHASMTGQTRAEIRETLQATDRRLRDLGLQPTDLMRPPYGAIDDRVRTAIGRVGLVPVLWDVDPRDWEGGSSATIAARILAQLHPHGSNIVLQHDGVGNSPASVGAVPRVVHQARRRGYCFVALDEKGRPGFPTPELRMRVAGGAEGGRATVTLTLDKPAGRATHVRLRTAAGSAKAGRDFTRRDEVVTFPAGVQSRVVPIRLTDDDLDERVERFEVRLSHPFGLKVAEGRTRVRIADRDRPPRVRVLGSSVEEPTEGTAVATVTVQLAKPSGRLVRVRLRDVPGTATAEDYERFDVWVRLAPGTTTATVPVTVLADAVDEPEESFGVKVRRVVNARSLAGPGVVTIEPPAPPPPPPDPRHRHRHRAHR